MLWLTPIVYVALLVVTFVVRRAEGSWYSPAAFFLGAWSLLAGLPLVFGPTAVPPAGLVFVLGAGLSMALGAELARRRLGPTGASGSPSRSLPGLPWLIAGSTVLGVIAVALVLQSKGRGLDVFLSPAALRHTAHEFSVARYSEGWQEPVLARVLVTAMYLGPLLSGVLVAARSTRSRWLSLLALVPGGMMAAVLTTKASLVLPVVFIVASYLASRLALGAPPTLKARQSVVLFGLAIAGAATLVLIQMGRYAYTTPTQAVTVATLLMSQLFPYLGVFSNWFQQGGWHTLHPSWGAYSLAGVFDLLHLSVRPSGLYTDQAMVNGAPYNVYTVFRGVIEDFTVPGAIAVFGLVGYAAEVAYHRVRLGDFRSVAVLAAFFVFTMWSFVVDIFIYNTVLLACVLLAFYLRAVWRPATRAIPAVDETVSTSAHLVRDVTTAAASRRA